MTASGDPAACIRFAMSGVAPACKSCEPFFECVPPDREEIAESIDDVRGGPRAISTRCAEAIGRVLEEEPPGGFEIRTGSETLLEGPFVSCIGRGYLPSSISIGRVSACSFMYLGLFSSGFDSTEESLDL